MRGLLVGVMYLFISSCGIERQAPLDFCKEPNRQISKQERIADVLVDILKNEEAYVRDFGPEAVHYFSWRRDYRLKNPNVGDVDIALTYYSLFPNCCEVRAPRYLDDALLSDDGYDASYGLEEQRYVAEVFVWRQLPLRENRTESDAVIRPVWPCDEKIGDI